MAPTGRDVWRDFVSDGIPSSGKHNPSKKDIRDWSTKLESLLAAVITAGGRLYTSRAAMNADLTPPANTPALVIGDPVVTNNGLYMKVGAPGAGSWARVGDVPGYQFVRAENVGAGTANAIVATSALPISNDVLVYLTVAATNTASPVTVTFNGGAALTVKTNGGNDPVVGGLVAGIVLLGVISGTTFRLVSDQASSAIVAAAEEWALIAQAAANSNLTFENLAIVQTANIPAEVDVIRTSGNRAAGDGLPRQFRRASAEPTKFPKVQSLDGAWWEGVGPFWRRPSHHRAGKSLDTSALIIRDGSVDGFHRHFGSIAEGLDGRIHLVYRKAAQHGLTSGETVWYCYSDDGGATWSAERVLVPSAPGYDQRGMSLAVSPTGRIVLVHDRCPAPTGAPTLLMSSYSDDNGLTWSNSVQFASIPYAYCRAYGRIKVVPGGNNYGYRLVTTPYYQSSATPTYKVAVWVSDDDGVTWAEQGAIVDGVSGENETEIVAVTATIWFAALRSVTGIKWYVSQDAGATWTNTGTVPNTSTDSYVSTSLDKFYHRGELCILLGYCDRSTDVMTWRIGNAKELVASPLAFGGRITVGTDLDNASGYQGVLTDPSGYVRFEEGVGYVEFKEYVGQTYSQVRFRSALFEPLALVAGRSTIIAAGVITVGSSALDELILVDTEAAAALDDLDTINGGVEKQVLRIQSASSSRDTMLRNGTGNLRLRSDYRLSTANVSEIVLIRVGAIWYELGRAVDQTPQSNVIASGVVSVPNGEAGRIVSTLIDTESSAATDDLDTINGGVEGQIIVLQSASSSRDTTIKNGTGNIICGTDFVLTSANDTMMLIKRGASWLQLSRSDNA